MTWRVLVVDDEQSLAKVVASYLERDGHRVNCVFDGPSAVAAARQRPPDVVVLDLAYPASTASRCVASSARSPTAMWS